MVSSTGNMNVTNEVSRILMAIEDGHPLASEDLLPIVYEELRRLASAKLAREQPGQTLQATALVHEVYLRLVGAERAPCWESKRHFFAAAAEAMRWILMNRARDKQRDKRGGGRKRLELEQLDLAVEVADEDVLCLDAAIVKLGKEDSLCSELVKLRFFAGLKQGEAARALELPRRTADRYWAFARAWLYDELSKGDDV